MKCVCLLLLCCLAVPTFQAEINLSSGWGRSAGNRGSSWGSSSNRCDANQFQCHSGSCISQSYVCDGDRDCPGGEDERGCSGSGSGSARGTTRRRPSSADDEQCSSAEFDCGRGGAGRYGRCIPNSPTFICDGADDCSNGADERNCRATTTERSRRGSCKTGEFQCSSGRCLRPNWVCDGAEDCSDGEDERNCRGVTSRTTARTTRGRRPSPSGRLQSTSLDLRPHYVNGLKVVASPWSKIFTKTARTKEECGAQCTDRNKCKLVSYDKNSKSCEGYGEDVEARFAFDEDFSSYGYWTETATRFPGVTFPGEDITYRGQPIADYLKITWTEQVCMQVCHIHPKCNMAVFNTKTNKCQLREHSTSRLTPTNNQNYVTILFGDEWNM